MAKLKLLKIIFLVSGFLLFFLLISYCSNILLIGEKLGLVIHPSAEIIFDVLLLLLIFCRNGLLADPVYKGGNLIKFFLCQSP